MVRRGDGEVERADCEGNRPVKAMKANVSGRRTGGQLLPQYNLNRSSRDLMFQSLVERRVGLVTVAEPYSIPDASRGAGDLIGSVHILERDREKPLLFGDRAGTGLCGRELGRPGRGGRLCVA